MQGEQHKTFCPQIFIEISYYQGKSTKHACFTNIYTSDLYKKEPGSLSYSAGGGGGGGGGEGDFLKNYM